MVIIIACVLVGLVIAARETLYESEWHERDWGEFFGFSFFLSTMAGVIGFVLMIGVSASLPRKMNEQPTTVVKLVNLRSNEGVSGQFFLGSGRIGEELYYFWYQNEGDGYITPRKMMVRRGVYVKEEDRQDAILATYHWGFTRPWMKYIGLEPNSWTSYFFVPRGTVIRNYELR